jgi:hypothetical protein
MTKIIHSDSVENEEPKNFSKGYLTLPFEGEQFKKFIASLLGKPQSISKRISGTFEVHLSDLQSLHDLVIQRVTQQNNGNLIQFTAKVYFTDESSVQLGSYDELVTYNEVKPIISEAVKLTWDFLIQFSDKDHPEKQVVEVLIISSVDRQTIEANDIPLFFYRPNGEFRINIEHTARSWGSDIESLLTNQIKSLIKKENKYKSFARRYSNQISLGFAALFFLSCIIGAFKATNSFISSQLETVSSFNSDSAKTAADKISFLTSYVASGVSSQHYFQVGIFLLIALIIAIVFGVWIEETASKIKDPSFVVITRKAKDYRDEIKEKMKQKWIWFFVSIGASIGTGIAANFIFKWLVE